MVFSDEEKILIKKSLYLKGHTAKRLTDKFPEKKLNKALAVINWLFLEPPNATRQQSALFRATHILSNKYIMFYAFVFLNFSNILLAHKIKHSAYTVTRVNELKLVHLKCNLFAFLS